MLLERSVSEQLATPQNELRISAASEWVLELIAMVSCCRHLSDYSEGAILRFFLASASEGWKKSIYVPGLSIKVYGGRHF